MASRPDPPDLEGFIDDSFYFDRLAPGSRERLIAFYEPHRERIEYAMSEDYDPETMSWRDWRNSHWSVLPECPQEIFMSDEEIRVVERMAVAGDQEARTRLTALRLRRRSGVVWVWIEEPRRGQIDIDGSLARHGVVSPPQPETLPPAWGDRHPTALVELMILGYAAGGETTLDGSPSEPTPKRAWALACLSVEAGVFGREETPRVIQGVTGPYLYDIGSFKLVRLSVSDRVFVDGPTTEASP